MASDFIKKHLESMTSTDIEDAEIHREIKKYTAAIMSKLQENVMQHYKDLIFSLTWDYTITLRVVVSHNGQVISVEIQDNNHRSHIRDALLNVVQLSSPFDAFPNFIKEGHDTLDITEEWNLKSSKYFKKY